MIHKRRQGFTLVELLVVITIIGILTALTLGAAKVVMDKAAKARAQGEISAIELALERYKIDNGDYPTATYAYSSGTLYRNNPTDYKGSTVSMGTDGSYTAPANSGAYVLFAELMGRTRLDGNSVRGQGLIAEGRTQYIELKKNQVDTTTTPNSHFIKDPWGFPYGYYYKYDGMTVAEPNTKSLFNGVVPDLWSTAGETGAVSLTTPVEEKARYLRWMANWPNK